MLRVGLVSVDPERKWIGGRYYLQHIVRAVRALPPQEQVELSEVSWLTASEDDPFAEVGAMMGKPVVITPPTTIGARLMRKARRRLRGWTDARDLFLSAGIDAVFPIAPCANLGIPLVFWMPDFQPWRLPDLFTPALRDWYQQHYAENGATAARIVVSSEDGLRDLAHYFPQFREKARSSLLQHPHG